MSWPSALSLLCGAWALIWGSVTLTIPKVRYPKSESPRAFLDLKRKGWEISSGEKEEFRSPGWLATSVSRPGNSEFTFLAHQRGQQPVCEGLCQFRDHFCFHSHSVADNLNCSAAPEHADTLSQVTTECGGLALRCLKPFPVVSR